MLYYEFIVKSYKGNAMTTSIKNYTNTFNIRGKEIKITAPA